MEYKSVERYLQKKNQTTSDMSHFRSFVLGLIHKSLLSGLIFISTLCMIKVYPDTKEVIYKKVFQEQISFARINQWYEKNFGSLIPVDSFFVHNTQAVFQEQLVYHAKEAYQDGVKLTVDNNYLVPVLESGIVVFVGNKDHYGPTVIIQQVDGVDLWYVNVKYDSAKLYDYVEKGSLLGETLDTNLYLYYQKSGEFLDYQKYLP